MKWKIRDVDEYVDISHTFYDIDNVTLTLRLNSLPIELLKYTLCVELGRMMIGELDNDDKEKLKQILVETRFVPDVDNVMSSLDESGDLIDKYIILLEKVGDITQGITQKLELVEEEYNLVKEFLLENENYLTLSKIKQI